MLHRGCQSNNWSQSRFLNLVDNDNEVGLKQGKLMANITNLQHSSVFHFDAECSSTHP